ncbi:MAG: circularly permuted type 2 ATP-grasp protein [Oceanicoccus sp.]
MSNPINHQTLGQAQSQAQSGQPNTLDYRQVNGLVDDAFAIDGSVKPQWEYLLNSLRNLGPEVMAERAQKVRRILRDDGATFNIYGGDGSPGSSWELDPVPHIIGSEDWGNIEAGLLERAELFNLVLRDIYGSRTLLRQGILPPEALFSHGGFVRACQGIQLAGEHELIMHAVDMVRQPDGSMCVLSDRTQAPSGSGYVLENRTVMSRVFPSLYRDSHVHRLASFYQRLRLKLVSLSPSDDPPLIAVLTPGNQSETYFEHTYLANYMGFPLVQSGDLIVRNGFVWMKSLDGLKRVDVILRQVEDAFCDPVELRSNSQLGVPGLLEVVRSGRVVIANPLGSGVLENPILLKYLPQISKCLLGREPRLSSVKTYWCGDESDLAFVTANIRQLIIKPAYRGIGVSSVWGGDLNAEQQNQLLATIRHNRYQYVAQERLEKPHIPAFSPGILEPRPALLRTFSIATDSSYAVLPGGLTRIGTNTHGLTINMQSGSPSKDTWVTASEPERTLDFDNAADSSRANIDSQLVSLPSRVVENLYWMGRYAERAEVSLRFLRTVFLLLNSEEPTEDDARRILLQTVTQITATLPGFMNASEQLLLNPDEELLLIIKDGGRIGSIKSTLNAMLSSADQSKELLSTDTIRVINDLGDALEQMDIELADGLTSAPEDALDPLVTGLAALSGLMQESMIRSVGWRFMELGKRIERALQTINTIDNLMTPVTSEAGKSTLLTALLISMEAFMTYRRGGREHRGLELGLELVMLDNSNPRSLIFQLEVLQQHLGELPKSDTQGGELGAEERALLEAMTSLKLSRISKLLESNSEQRDELKNLLEHLKKLLRDFNRFISEKHFEHRANPQQLVTSTWGAQ